ncbi:MAG TPA: S24 family peptidase [Candidatus Saccharimonadales bacterium]|nr:S24 family peptidase [Candidatus Saccharimonadales bacterium]
MKYAVSPEQEKVLNATRAYFNLHGQLPTLSYVQGKLGYKHASAVQHHMVALREKGLLDFTANPLKTRDVPLAGNVACGPAMLAEENIDTYIPYPEEQLKRNSQYFFLRASGDSMNEAGIDDGDYLLVRQTQEAGKNDRIIVLIGDEATCKYLRYEDGLPVLVPSSSNPMNKKRILLEDFSVLGVVDEVVKPERRAYS